MSDKKNDDYVVRMPGIKEDGENDPFMARSATSPTRPTAPGLANPLSKIDNNPAISVLAYCLSSISMTVVNKYVVSGSSWNLNFFYLAVQSTVCILAIVICKQLGLIKNLARFDAGKARRCKLSPGWVRLDEGYG